MADVGHLVIDGFKAGAIAYVVLDGFAPNPSATTVAAGLVTMGYGTPNAHKLFLDGFAANPSGIVGGTGSFSIFGGSIITGTGQDGWL